MKKIILLVMLLNITGCFSQSTPMCNDEEVGQDLNRLSGSYLEQLIGFEPKFTLNNIKQVSHDKESDQYNCSADITYGGTATEPVKTNINISYDITRPKNEEYDYAYLTVVTKNIPDFKRYAKYYDPKPSTVIITEKNIIGKTYNGSVLISKPETPSAINFVLNYDIPTVKSTLEIENTVAMFEGDLAIINHANKLKAINTTNGKTLWEIEEDLWPKVQTSKITITLNDNEAVAVSNLTGQIMWRNDYPADSTAMTVSSYESDIAIQNNYGDTIHIVDIVTGENKNSLSIPYELSSFLPEILSVKTEKQMDEYIIHDSRDGVFAINPKINKVVWSTKISTKFNSDPTITKSTDDKHIGAWDYHSNKIFVLDSTTGNIVYEFLPPSFAKKGECKYEIGISNLYVMCQLDMGDKGTLQIIDFKNKKSIFSSMIEIREENMSIYKDEVIFTVNGHTNTTPVK